MQFAAAKEKHEASSDPEIRDAFSHPFFPLLRLLLIDARSHFFFLFAHSSAVLNLRLKNDLLLSMPASVHLIPYRQNLDNFSHFFKIIPVWSQRDEIDLFAHTQVQLSGVFLLILRKYVVVGRGGLLL